MEHRVDHRIRLARWFPGDAVQTVQKISGSPLLYFSGIASVVVVALLDIIVAGALHTLFKPVSRRLSPAAAWMRTVYAVLLPVAISRLVIKGRRLAVN